MRLRIITCPFCFGFRATGIIHHTRCILCNARGEISKSDVESGLSKLDVVHCPRCLGRGTLGSRRRLCDTCMGSQTVPRSAMINRKENDFLLVNCPRCEGRGKTGFNKACDYCLEDGQVSNVREREYVKGQNYSVECPCCFKTPFVYKGRCRVCGNLKKIHRIVVEYIEGDFTKLETKEEAIKRILRGCL